MTIDIPALTTAQRQAPQAISPTDISQFVRLDQCQRYLRLRLHERTQGPEFLRDYDVAQQSIPPILTRSGATFEQAVEQSISQRYPTHRFTDRERKAANRTNDNQPVTDRVASLAPGQVTVIFQPRLQSVRNGWNIRGDIDILRLERTPDGQLHASIADIKSTTTAKVEHRLQVAFYQEVLTDLLARSGQPVASIDMAILYRGPADHQLPRDTDNATSHQDQAQLAVALFGVEDALLEQISDPEAYLETVRDLVTGPRSTANRVLGTAFDDIPFHLTYKCDGCVFNEFCMKYSAETDDLSLIPHLALQDKQALHDENIFTTKALAGLKDIQQRGTVQIDGTTQKRVELTPAPGKEAISRRLASAWPIGPRLDQLVHRAKRSGQWNAADRDYVNYIPNQGYGSFPYSDAEQNPNLVRIYIDAQHDHMLDRIYLLGALVVASENGVEVPSRRRSVVHLTDGPPVTDAIEEALFINWVRDTLSAVVTLAAPDAEGRPRAPIHLIFINDFSQRLLLEGLARHAQSVLGATALYDFVTQVAAFDSPVLSFLETQIRERKNYPMICQSLQSVAAYLRFDWNEGAPYREIFNERLFDFWGKLPGKAGEEDQWYTRRARFNSQIPLEFAYAAWNQLEAGGSPDDLEPYQAATPDLLTGFHARRLAAMEHIAHDFSGNKQTLLTSFELPDLAGFQQLAPTFAHALDEFVTVERHVELAEWKSARLPQPEQRVLAGNTFVVRYLDEYQEPDVVAANEENTRRYLLARRYEAESDDGQLTKEQRAETKWSNQGLQVRLRMETADVACTLDEAISLSTLKPGERLIIFPRVSRDTRLPSDQQRDFTPTVKQLLYGSGASLDSVEVERDANGNAVRAWVVVTLIGKRNESNSARGFAFPTYGFNDLPLVPDRVYTLDKDPNDYSGARSANVTEGLINGGQNLLFSIFTGTGPQSTPRAIAWTDSQQRFMAGLRALHAVGAMHQFEDAKQEFIGGHADAPLLLVQGPPGTGKSFSTAYALLARVQGALAADRDFRVFIACRTHAAIDVLIENVLKAQLSLREIAKTHCAVFEQYFDRRLLDLPLFRYDPKGEPPEGIHPIRADNQRPAGTLTAYSTIRNERWVVVGLTPGSIYKLQGGKKTLFSRRYVDCVILDEASQINIPEAITATLPLRDDGIIIVVGDHRQMPPIVKNDWSSEKRRTFQVFRSYESLFLALIPLAPPMIKFAESFRLHADMAAFLQQEIYRHDQIDYHSRRRDVLDRRPINDDFVAAVLLPDHPLTVVVHDEDRSQHRNRFEQALMTPILQILAAPNAYNLGPETGMGVVVPHRAQRAAMQEDLPLLSKYDPATGAMLLSAIDTVERFQGGERDVILIGATESDRGYLLMSGDFLLNPQRLTVALSRARLKLVLIAARSVFELFSAEEETFAHAQLWKNLLRKTCTVPLWQGQQYGHGVEVWGNRSSSRAE